jgi:hypothetical protein
MVPFVKNKSGRASLSFFSLKWLVVNLVPDGLGEERITEGLTALSFLIKAIFASSPAFVGLDILVAVYIN